MESVTVDGLDYYYGDKGCAGLSWFNHDDSTLTLDWIKVTDDDYVNQGIGSALLKKVISDADENDWTLILDVCPSGRLDFNDLVSWYGRYGFVLDSVPNSILMKRLSNS